MTPVIRARRRQRESFMPWLRMAVDLAVIYALLAGVFWLRFQSGMFEETLSAENTRVYFRTFHLVALMTVFFRVITGCTARLRR